MIASISDPLLPASKSALPAEYLEPRWYAAYTCPRHEKRVVDHLERRAVECFLPLYEVVRKWKSGRARVQLPLFPGYLFARIALRDRLRVLEVPSVVRLVGFNGFPSALPDDQIQTLRNGLSRNLRAEPHPFLAIGRRVRINRGPLAGLEGILLRRKGHLRIVVSIELIHQAVAVEIEASDVQILYSAQAGIATGGQVAGCSLPDLVNRDAPEMTRGHDG